MSIVFFSVQSAAGSTLSVQQWKMLDPPFSVTFRPIDALNVLCAQLTRDLFAIAKFLFPNCYKWVKLVSATL